VAEPWPAGIVLLAVALGIPGLAIFAVWPRPEPAPDGPQANGDGAEAGASRTTARARAAARARATATRDTYDAERALVALGVPVSLFVVATELLAKSGALTAGAVWTLAVGMAAAGIIAMGVWRARWLADLRAADRARRWLTHLPAVGVVLAAASAQIALVVDRMDSLPAPTPWYYWQQSLAIARAGDVPSLSREWGTAVGFFDYHLGFNAASAAIARATYSLDSLFGAQLLRILIACSAVVGLWLFARVWGAPRYAAAAAAVAVPCVSIFAIKLSSYRPETAAYLLALAPAALLHRWFLRPRWPLGAAVLVTFAGVTQVHAPGAIVAATLCGATALAHARPSWRWVVRVVAVGAALVAVWFVVDRVTGHRGPFSDQFAAPPELTADGRDPTYEFAQLATAQIPADRAQLGVDPPAGDELLKKSLTDGFLVGGTTTYWVLIAAVGATLAAALALRRWTIVRYMVAGILFLGLLVLVSVVTQLGWDTYVPRRTGYSRFFQFWWFVPLAGVALAARLVDRAWWRIGVSALLVAVAGTLWVRSLDATSNLDRTQPSVTTLEQLRALPLRPGAIVLSNAFTQDFVQVNTTGDGLTDGRAPYLEERLLRRANRILRATSAFFADPLGVPFPWDRYDVQYVLVSTVPNSLGNPAIYPTDPAVLDALPQLARTGAGEGWVLYEVRR
jgi:hypothetical protein